MKTLFQYSIGNLLVACVLVALVLTVVVQHARQLAAEAQFKSEIAQLRNRLHAAELALPELPVDDPKRVYILAEPAYAYGRWTWRAYVPPGNRYTLHIDVGTADHEGKITSASGYGQIGGLMGTGITTIMVEQFDSNVSPLLGVSVGKANSVCRLTPEVDRCFATRPDYEEERLGVSGVVEVQPGERIDLVRRWYPQPGPDDVGPVGFSVWLEPQ
ncbi:hypothetical protein [Planctomycetes bacterium CA13]